MSGKGTAVAGVGALAIVVGLAALLGELFFGPGGSGEGAGPGTGQQTQVARPDAPPSDVRTADLPGRVAPATQSATGPLRIVIEGDQYLIDDRPHDLAAVREILKAKAAAPGNAFVEVIRRPNARAKAEEDLKAELEKLPLRVATD